MKCPDQNDISGQLKLEGWLYVLLFFTLFNEEATFYKQFGRGGAILLVIFGEETPVYWLCERGGIILLGRFGRRLAGVFFLIMSKTMQEVGWSFILWFLLYLEGWSSRSSYFFDVA